MSSGRPGREASAPPVTLCEVIEEGSKAAPPPRSLVLRLKPKSAVRWEEGTVDNEGCGRKSSKRCCIFHRRKAFNESDSDESDSDIEEAVRKEEEGGPEAIKRNYQRHHA